MKSLHFPATHLFSGHTLTLGFPHSGASQNDCVIPPWTLPVPVIFYVKSFAKDASSFDVGPLDAQSNSRHYLRDCF